MLHIENTTPDSIDEPALRRLAAIVLRAEGKPAKSEVNLMLCHSAAMQGYNRRFRGADRPTDVLSFVAEDPYDEALGDILIDTQTATRQKGNRTLDGEVQMLFLHGLLHLLGHDHQGAAQRTAMEETQQRYIQLFRQGES